MNFNNGVPDDEVKDEIETAVKRKFNGDSNAGQILIAFNDSKDNGVTVEKIDDDQRDAKYQSLRTDTYKEIFTAFRMQPQLIGYSLEGTAFNSVEFEQAFKLFNKTTVSPIQKDIIRVFRKIYGVEEPFAILPFQINFEENE